MISYRCPSSGSASSIATVQLPVESGIAIRYFPRRARSKRTDRQAGQRSEVLQGTLEMLALKLLTAEPMHGWGLSLKLRQISRDVFDVNQGSLYPALQRMLRRGWIRAEWRASENNRRARYYMITREGLRQLDAEIEEWERSSGAVNRVLRYAFQGG